MNALSNEAVMPLPMIDVLLVEDTETDAAMTLRALRKCGLDGRVMWLRDGSEALAFLYPDGGSPPRPKIILLDLKMPKVDGLEVLRRIMHDDNLRTVPVVMLSSSAEERDIAESYRLGANSYIVKPVDATAYHRVVIEAGQYWTNINRVAPPVPAPAS